MLTLESGPGPFAVLVRPIHRAGAEPGAAGDSFRTVARVGHRALRRPSTTCRPIHPAMLVTAHSDVVADRQGQGPESACRSERAKGLLLRAIRIPNVEEMLHRRA